MLPCLPPHAVNSRGPSTATRKVSGALLVCREGTRVLRVPGGHCRPGIYIHAGQECHCALRTKVLLSWQPRAFPCRPQIGRGGTWGPAHRWVHLRRSLGLTVSPSGRRGGTLQCPPAPIGGGGCVLSAGRGPGRGRAGARQRQGWGWACGGWETGGRACSGARGGRGRQRGPIGRPLGVYAALMKARAKLRPPIRQSAVTRTTSARESTAREIVRRGLGGDGSNLAVKGPGWGRFTPERVRLQSWFYCWIFFVVPSTGVV